MKIISPRMHTDAHGLKHGDLTDKVLGVFYRVYNDLGYGFLESVYEQAMIVALKEHGLAVEQQVPVPVWFHGQQVGDFRADLLVDSRLLLEIKAVRKLESAHEAQALNYLKATQIEVAMLLNFGPRPEFRRLLFDNERKRERATATGV